MYVKCCVLLPVRCLHSSSVQVENGRIIIDPYTFNIHGMPGPNLELLGYESREVLNDDNVFDGVYNVIYKATDQDFRGFQKALEKCQEQQRRNLTTHSKPDSRSTISTRARRLTSVTAKALSHKQHLFCAPVIKGYCLTSKSWGESSVPMNANSSSLTRHFFT